MDPVIGQRDFRRARWLLPILMVITLTAAPGGGTAAASAPPVPSEPAPASTLNVFMPEQENLSTCQSLAVQRPGCGSKARGGWRQTLVFVVIAAALVLIGVRLFLAVRRRDRALNA